MITESLTANHSCVRCINLLIISWIIVRTRTGLSLDTVYICLNYFKMKRLD